MHLCVCVCVCACMCVYMFVGGQKEDGAAWDKEGVGFRKHKDICIRKSCLGLWARGGKYKVNDPNGAKRPERHA